MTVEEHTIREAAERRARALAERDPVTLRRLLHPDFRWTSFRGEVFDRDAYVESNTTDLVWHSQRLEELDISVSGDTGVLTGIVIDEVERDDARETFRMRVTQIWVRGADGWTCLAGHAGPRV